MKDNDIFDKNGKISTEQIDHLRMINEVEHQDLNKVMKGIRNMFLLLSMLIGGFVKFLRGLNIFIAFVFY